MINKITCIFLNYLLKVNYLFHFAFCLYFNIMINKEFFTVKDEVFMKKTIIIIAVSLVLAIFLPFIFHGKISLLLFINSTFFISGAYLFLTLLTITVKSGFYDGITLGFRRFFTTNGKYLSRRESENMIPLSKVITFNQVPILISGLTLFFIMLFCLFIHYSSQP